MKKLRVEQFSHPLNRMMNANYRIVEDDSTQFPVCNFGLSSLEQQPKPLLERQEKYAKLLATAPELLKALQDTVAIIGKLTDRNVKKHYAQLSIQYAENLKIIKKALGDIKK